MNILRFIYRMTKFAIQNIFRNFWLSFITLTIFLLTLITINAVLFVNVIADTALQSIEQRVEVSVYFSPETSEDIAKSAQAYVAGLDQVREVTYESADIALANFKERNANNDVILQSLEEVGGNPFGHALVISAYDSNDFPFILEALETPEYSQYIKEKDYTDYEVIIDRIRSLSDRMRIAGFMLAGFFSLIAIMIVFNTIRVAIYVHREEIAIMKLVGANDWFVRGPFLLEVLLYSILAIAIVMTCVYFALGRVEPLINSFFGSVDVSVAEYFAENAFLIFGGQWIVLVVLSMLTTAFAMRRYLRV